MISDLKDEGKGREGESSKKSSRSYAAAHAEYHTRSTRGARLQIVSR